MQQGLFQFEGRQAGLSGRMEGLTIEIASLAGNRYRGLLDARKATLELSDAEPILCSLNLRFRLDPARGVVLEESRVAGGFGELTLSGSVEDLKHPLVRIRGSASVHIAEVERLFRFGARVRRRGAARGSWRVPAAGGFRFAGRLSSPRSTRRRFLRAWRPSWSRPPQRWSPTRAGALPGEAQATGALRIEGWRRRTEGDAHEPLGREGRSLGRAVLRRHPPSGHGPSGTLALSVALHWAEGGIERASGGGIDRDRASPPRPW